MAISVFDLQLHFTLLIKYYTRQICQQQKLNLSLTRFVLFTFGLWIRA